MRHKIAVDQKLSYWQQVFHSSPVNGSDYHGDELPHTPWKWPTNGYLSRKLNRSKDERQPDAS